MNTTALIIDDSLTVRMDLVEAMEGAGFACIACATAADARRALAAGPVDFVILDVLLPDGDGVELLKEIRSAPHAAAAPVLMLSTEAEIKDRIRGLQTGADEYVGKPYDAPYVVSRARELMRDRKSTDASKMATVLIIDDSMTFREALRGAMESAGYAVLTAASGEEGLRVAADRRPNAILVDGVLPGIDGPTVIRHIRLDMALQHIPCVLLTAADSQDSELNALDAGADAFVRKGEDVELILARLGAVLRAVANGTDHEGASLLSPKKILAVDDSPTYLHQLASELRIDGYDTVLAHSGEEALQMLAVQPVDCILMDMMMPGLDGKETCRRIKAAPIVRDIPLIILTAIEDRNAMIDGLSTGADDYISKSSEFDVLKARVRAQLRRKQFEDESRRVREELLQKEREAIESRAAKELAESRAILVDELERKNKELESFSYSVSHDLRAPLRAIDGFSQMLEEDYREKLDDGGRSLIDKIRGSGRKMAQLIDDMLEFSRSGRTKILVGEVDMAAMVQGVVEDLRRDRVNAAFEVILGELPTARCDSALMRQVWVNLIGNAVKFSGKRDKPLIEVSADETGTDCVYCVRDNGAGFDMAYAQNMFGVFQRFHREDEFHGTGVGLAIVSQIVTRHGGRIWAEGKKDEGAAFYFSLPKPKSA